MSLKQSGKTLDEICVNFVDAIKTFAQQGILTQGILQDYSKSKWTFHGLLVSAFAEAGWRARLLPIIEPRVALSQPLDPSQYARELTGRPKRHQVRLDLGYYRQGLLDLDTFAECNTINGALDYKPSTGKDYVSKRDVLTHFAQYANPKASGLIICITLPRNVTRKGPWPDQKQLPPDYFKELKPDWDNFAQHLRQYIDVRLVVLEENGVHINGLYQPISIHQQ